MYQGQAFRLFVAFDVLSIKKNYNNYALNTFTHFI